MGTGLREKRIRFRLEGLHRIGAGSETNWGLVKSSKAHERVGKFGGVASLLAVHAVPRRDGFLRRSA